jgi:cold shock CspA family protein
MATGKVKWWSDEKGFGFITPDDGSDDIFAHFSNIVMEGFKTLEECQPIQYETEQAAKGPIATAIRPLATAVPLNTKQASLIVVQRSRRTLKVFLCHSSGDKAMVRELCARLTRIPYLAPWLDEEKLLPGQDWNLEITTAVKDSDCVVVCLSNSSINKEGYVQKEITFALDAAQEKPEGTIFLIPVRLEECRPPARIERWHYVNLYEPTGFERLLLSLQHRATSLQILIW